MIKNKLILKQDTGVEEAIKLLDGNGNGVLPVVNGENKLIGIITDGDLRRAMLNKTFDLNQIINNNPTSLNYLTPKNNILSYLKSINRRHLPLVDKNGHLVDLFVLDDINLYNKKNPVVIMAGGLGSRLGDLTKDTPKPMLKVGGKPIIEHIIKNFVHYGFCDIYVSVNYKADIIKDYLGDGNALGANIKYLTESNKLGTAGALSLIEDKIEYPLIVINGDVISTLDIEDLLNSHNNSESIATICTRKITEQISYGVLDVIDGKILSIKEKPINTYFISAGIYVLEPEVLGLLTLNTHCDITTLFEKLINKNESINAYEIDDYWIDIGRKDDYFSAVDSHEYFKMS